MSMKPQIPVLAEESEESLAFIRQMGIEYVDLHVRPEEVTYDFIRKQQEKLQRHFLYISDVTCSQLQKNKSIHLALPDREQWIRAFVNLLEVLGRTGIAYTSIAWQPNGILRSGCSIGFHTRGGDSFFCDQKEILMRPWLEKRSFEEKEIWDNFQYFMERVIPVAESTGVRIALHPNDPPLACMEGIPSLIYNMECYRKAFRVVKGSRALGVKLCVGCWLEGGNAFGEIMSDIEELSVDDRILCVHFRNVDSPLPVFEETLAEDGYGDMYAIMKKLVACDCNAMISVDHSFQPMKGFGGMAGSFSYPTGFMKGLLWAAEKELGKR